MRLRSGDSSKMLENGVQKIREFICIGGVDKAGRRQGRSRHC